MKKFILLYVALLVILLTSCATPKSETIPEAVEEMIEENIEEDIDEELVDEESEQNKTDDIEEISLAEEIKIDTGRFKGLADANFFEVKISGVPDFIPPKMFMLTEEVREKFNELNLQQDDEIKIHYYETNGQLAVTDIEKISQ